MRGAAGGEHKSVPAPLRSTLPALTVVPVKRFSIVVGKGGVGKTTTAASLARELAGQGRLTHLISTDPAHSLSDCFEQPLEPGQVTVSNASDRLLLEEFAALLYADRWLDQVRPALAELIERGTYLDAADASAFFDRAIPGVDEVMAAFRIAELEESAAEHIVIDTAPTGHLLRLLDAPEVVATWIDALEAMAAKAGTVASALLGGTVRLSAEHRIHDWRTCMERFRAILRSADFIVVQRLEPIVQAETRRLTDELEMRGLHVTRIVEVDAPNPASTPPSAGLHHDRPAVEWLQTLPQRILFFAGKGGVGKSTCACAAAEVIAKQRKTLLLSTDPAGSLADVLGIEVGGAGVQLGPNLVARQLDAPAVMQSWREANRSRIEEVLTTLGLAASAPLDHNVIARIWQLAPPGLDELIAFAEILDAVENEQTVVVDSAPTGHFLRLLAMPDAATDWAHAAMRLLLKYGAVAALEDAARELLDFAKQAKRLRQLLSDSGRTAVFVVTLPERMVLAETARLQAALGNATIPVSALIFNRTDAGPIISRFQSSAGPRPIRAPEMVNGVAGRADLLRFANAWELLD